MHESAELLVYDEVGPCPYLAGREARMPLRQPVARLTGEQFDQRLAAGDRRTGPFLYRTTCPSCQACVPMRVPVTDFQPNRSQRRALRRGDQEIVIQVRRPIADARRAELYNRHSHERGLGVGQLPVSVDDYRKFLVSSCCDTVELSYLVDGTLVAVAIVDRGAAAISAVYCCFDPDYSKFSLGVYSILTQIRLAQRWRMDYVYLGLYIEQSPHMNYKALYRPHEFLIDGQWRRSDD
ncbi:MAG: arginyltransferase [Gammaproteobacteria bacterium]